MVVWPSTISNILFLTHSIQMEEAIRFIRATDVEGFLTEVIDEDDLNEFNKYHNYVNLVIQLRILFGMYNRFTGLAGKMREFIGNATVRDHSVDLNEEVEEAFLNIDKEIIVAYLIYAVERKWTLEFFVMVETICTADGSEIYTLWTDCSELGEEELIHEITNFLDIHQ